MAIDAIFVFCTVYHKNFSEGGLTHCVCIPQYPLCTKAFLYNVEKPRCTLKTEHSFSYIKMSQGLNVQLNFFILIYMGVSLV